MPDLYTPEFKLAINGFDVTATITPHLISISLEDAFDTDFTVSKLDLTFHANYRRSLNWQFRDQLKLELWWKPFPLFKLVTGTFYVDYIEDIKATDGLQTFRVSALEADLTIGFTYGVNEITLTNKTTKQAVADFASLFSLTLSENMTANVYLGIIENAATNPNKTTVTAKYSSYAEMLKDICVNFGYFGNLAGKNLQIYQINSDFSNSTRFFLWAFQDIWSFEVKQSYTNLFKRYNTNYINNPTNTNWIQLFLEPQMSAQLNSKISNINSADGYFNRDSAAERLYGAMYGDFLKGFECVINCSGMPEFKAGNIFLLDSTYGSHEGYYRCTRVRHVIDAGGWNSEITGFPLGILQTTNASFKVGYTGYFGNPPASKTIQLSQLIRGTTTGLTAAMLDGYAKYYNNSYTSNVASNFINEGNKVANSIRPDVAFCIALIMTNNFSDSLLITRRNPGELMNAANTDIATFSDWLTGTRALVQTLFAYCTTSGSPADTIVAPRYANITRGSATTIDALNGKYNTELDFSSQVKEKLRQLYVYLNPTFNVVFID
jgi:hypothetical protein